MVELAGLATKVENHIQWVEICNEAQSNALSSEVIESLTKTLREADRNPDVRVIVLSGRGKAFCAGGDVKAMKDKTGMFAGESFELRNRYHFGIQEIPRTIESLQKPIIAMINGAAIGAGCDLVAMCDLRYASTKAKFGETFTKLSLVPGDGGPYFLTRAIGHTRASEMYLTGDIYDAKTMKDFGLINEVVEHETLKDYVQKIATKIAANAPGAVQLTKLALKQSLNSNLNDHLNLMSAYQGISQRMNDHHEGIAALLDKREAKFEGN